MRGTTDVCEVNEKAMSTLLTALRDNSQWQRCLILAQATPLRVPRGFRC